jgi:hypothetical protein
LQCESECGWSRPNNRYAHRLFVRERV